MKKSDPDAPKKHGGGPKTPEGKARSALNALRHGLLARTLVLPTESSDEFQELLKEYLHALAPDNPLESHLVEELVIARWRMERAWCIESTARQMGLKRTEEATLREYGKYGNVHTTNAFVEMSVTNRDLQLINRYETRLARRFHQVLSEIKSLRRDGLIRNVGPLPDAPTAPNCQTNSPATNDPEKCQTDSPQPQAPQKCETNSSSSAAREKCETNSAHPEPPKQLKSPEVTTPRHAATIHLRAAIAKPSPAPSPSAKSTAPVPAAP